MSLQSNIIDRSGNLDQTRAVPFLTAVSGLVGKIGDEPMVRKCRSRASRQVLIGAQLKTAKALGSEVPPMLLGRDKLVILELLGHGRLWIKRVALFDRRLPGNFRYASLATEIAWHRNMSRWAIFDQFSRFCLPDNVRFTPILLKKSFPADERNFLGPPMRFARRDVRDHSTFHKNDHGCP